MMSYQNFCLTSSVQINHSAYALSTAHLFQETLNQPFENVLTYFSEEPKYPNLGVFKEISLGKFHAQNHLCIQELLKE